MEYTPPLPEHRLEQSPCYAIITKNETTFIAHYILNYLSLLSKHLVLRQDPLLCILWMQMPGQPREHPRTVKSCEKA
jgi:hypothetical protein